MKCSSLIPLFLATSLFAVDSNTNYLSQTKQDILNYSYEKSIQDNDKLRKDKVKPDIKYIYEYNDDETYSTTSSTISVNQPIFKSGGIYNAIKYTSNMELYLATTNEIETKELIKKVLDILFEIKINQLSIQKQELLIANAQIDIQRKKEQVLNGILDASYLDNAILDGNMKKNAIIDLKLQHQTLINNLSNLTDKNYKNITLPLFELKDLKNFKQNNIYVKQLKEDLQNSYFLKNMAVSQYLPSVNLIARYSKYHDTDNKLGFKEDDSPSNIGFTITIPLDISFNNDIQSSKITYLQKKLALNDKITEEVNTYKTAIAGIKSINEKVNIAKNDVELYSSLLVQIQEQYQVGMKTLSDIQTMENSKNIKSLDIKILNFQKQLKFLEIYYRMKS